MHVGRPETPPWQLAQGDQSGQKRLVDGRGETRKGRPEGRKKQSRDRPETTPYAATPHPTATQTPPEPRETWMFHRWGHQVEWEYPESLQRSLYQGLQRQQYLRLEPRPRVPEIPVEALNQPGP